MFVISCLVAFSSLAREKSVQILLWLFFRRRRWPKYKTNGGELQKKVHLSLSLFFFSIGFVVLLWLKVRELWLSL